ncbi:MAG: hypothetical protein KC457_33035 [Myxococcales bacterium]|nr:hypothetical protein [Myxococcales bacterium]
MSRVAVVVTTPSLATMTPAQKAAAGHQMVVKPPCPDDGHSWDHDTYSCPDCWDKPCKPNAEITNEEYKAKQAGSPADRVRK